MNFNIKDDNNFIININSSLLELNEDNLYDELKKILINIRKKYAYNIYGFYNVDIYHLDPFLTILKFEKKDKDDYFSKSIDLKIIRHESDIKLTFKDYLLVKDYNNVNIKNGRINIKSKEIKKEDVYKLCEHYTIESLNLQ